MLLILTSYYSYSLVYLERFYLLQRFHLTIFESADFFLLYCILLWPACRSCCVRLHVDSQAWLFAHNTDFGRASESERESQGCYR